VHLKSYNTSLVIIQEQKSRRPFGRGGQKLIYRFFFFPPFFLAVFLAFFFFAMVIAD
jgi:hypothetical protein